ncbi:uncharacterized protein METZ01_LOCUS509370, partial [marine metagenome]
MSAPFQEPVEKKLLEPRRPVFQFHL